VFIAAKKGEGRAERTTALEDSSNRTVRGRAVFGSLRRTSHDRQ
jgi:hypothetical protein